MIDIPIPLLWGLAALAALTAGRWISVLAPALVHFLEARWQLEMADESGCNVMNRRLPGALPALWAQRRQARVLIPLLDQRRRHLAWEITALAVSLVTLVHGGMTLEGWVAVGVTWALLALIHTDLSDFLLLDCIVYPLLWAGLLWRASGHGDAIEGIYGAFFGYAALWGVAEGYGAIRGMKMMGNGDFKLAAALGAWLGWQALPLLLLTACVLALLLALLLTKTRRSSLGNPLPFGPALAVAGWVLLLLQFPA